MDSTTRKLDEETKRDLRRMTNSLTDQKTIEQLSRSGMAAKHKREELMSMAAAGGVVQGAPGPKSATVEAKEVRIDEDMPGKDTKDQQCIEEYKFFQDQEDAEEQDVGTADEATNKPEEEFTEEATKEATKITKAIKATKALSI